MKFATLAYVPPPTWGCAYTFLENLRMFETAHPLFLYSDYAYGVDFIKIGNPEPMRGANARWGINNALFWTAVRIAKTKELTHFLYLESDCRVNAGWDHAIFKEWAELKKPPLAAGTLICWNPMNAGMEVAKRWERLIVANNRKRNLPIATYGVRDSGPPKIFPCGALGIYDLNWLLESFDGDTHKFASGSAWDHSIGEKLWQQFGIESFDKVAMLRTVFSSFGNETTTEDERLEMLRSGKLAAVHQVKSNQTL